MKKGIVIGLSALLLISGCGESTVAKSDGATHIETVDEYNTFSAIKLVDEETGCKFMVVTGEGSHNPVLTQMLGADGLPVCE